MQELPPTKQKQKIVLLQKKLDLAEREEQKIRERIEFLRNEIRDTQLALVRRQVEMYEAASREVKKHAAFPQREMFFEEREWLHQITQNGGSVFEAQLLLDRILQLITELSNEKDG